MDFDFFRDILLVLGGILAGNAVFNNFEKHLPWAKRVAKHGVLYGILVLIRYFLSGWGLLAALLLITAGQVVLHAWWFPKHGINGLTAEPYEKYLELTEKMKGKKLG